VEGLLLAEAGINSGQQLKLVGDVIATHKANFCRDRRWASDSNARTVFELRNALSSISQEVGNDMYMSQEHTNAGQVERRPFLGETSEKKRTEIFITKCAVKKTHFGGQSTSLRQFNQRGFRKWDCWPSEVFRGDVTVLGGWLSTYPKAIPVFKRRREKRLY